MKGATECARRLKTLTRSLRSKLGKGGRRTSGDAVTQMILGILSRDVPESKARAALDRLRGAVVDYNELRVIPAIELAEMLGDFPDARLKSEDLSRSLNSLFMYEHDVSFERLNGASRKEIVSFIDGIDGIDAYTHARVRLYGFGLHAVPLDCAMWAYARKKQIVDPKCSLETAQSFLQRRLSEKEAPAVVALLEQQAWAELAAAVRSGKVEPIRSVPPDRTSRNMLQAVAAGQDGSAIGEEEEVDVDASEEVAAAAPESSPKRVKEAKKPAARKKSAGGGKSRAAKTKKKSAAAARSRAKRAKNAVNTKQRSKSAAKKPKAATRKTATRKSAAATRRSRAKAKSA